MDNLQAFTPNQSPSTNIPTSSNQTDSKFYPLILVSILLTAGIVGLVVFYWQKTVNEKQISNLRQEIIALQNQPANSNAKTIETTAVPSIIPTEIASGVFTYQNFSISHPKDWTLKDLALDPDFPLKKRLESLSDKSIAFTKNGIFLIITINQNNQIDESSGGIFVEDKDFNDFISTKGQLVINNSTFYLAKDHSDIISLNQAHSGPGGWSTLFEYIPNKPTQSGQSFRGYESLITRNGYSYNFIITSNSGAVTNPQIQDEIIGMLKTIKW